MDVVINLHTFLINTYGIIENIGLALAYENKLIGKNIRPKNVKLFEKSFQHLLHPKLQEYLKKQSLKNWHEKYAKNYRDALAHRIPPYVPPAALNDKEVRRFKDIEKEKKKLYKINDMSQIETLLDEQESLGSSMPFFTHSFLENSKHGKLHPQLIADFRTVEKLITKAFDNFYWSQGHMTRRQQRGDKKR